MRDPTMPIASEQQQADDDAHENEVYEEYDVDDEVKAMYEDVMNVIQKCNFEKADEVREFENTNEAQYLGVRNQTLGTFLHYWAKSPPSKALPANFVKWLFARRPGMIKEVDKDSRTPIHSVLDGKSADAKKFLDLVLRECPRLTLSQVLGKKDVGGNNCLHYAILRNSPWTLELIRKCTSLSENSLFTSGNNDNRTPLHLAMVPPRAKQQPRQIRRPQLDVNRGAFGSPRRTPTFRDNDQRSQPQSERPDFRDKETRNRDAGGMNTSAPLETRTGGPNQNALQPMPGGADRRPNDSTSAATRAIVPASVFPFQEVVQELMKYGSEALWKTDSTGKTPYQYRLKLMSEKKNNAVQEDQLSRTASEDPLAQDMKEFCLRTLGRGDAMRSLYERGKEKHIEFDLSGLPSSLSISKSDLDRLAHHLTFEDTLQYVAIPRLRLEDPLADKAHTPSTPDAELQDEMKDSKESNSESKAHLARDGLGLKDAGIIFKWLAERNVTRIFKVIVIDDGDPPHSNEVIEKSVKNFKIETWDWKKVDICSDTIFEAAPGAKVVNLYASGNSAVLKGWSSAEGLVKLKMLEKVKLIVRPGFEPEERRQRDVLKFQTTFKDNWRKKYKKDGPEPEIVWDDKEKSLSSWIQSDKGPDEKQRWLEHMDTFADFINEIDLEKERTERKKTQEKEGSRVPAHKRTKQFEDIKVAIIDDGVDGFDPTVSQSIAHGVSFCQGSPDLVNAYYVSSRGHGTMMARLILRICPTAKLYVARLQEHRSRVSGKRFITPESATEAVKWAITNGVHVLSMSWTIEGNKNGPEILNFKNAIEQAFQAGITMMCAFSDQGMSAPPGNTFPTAWKDECCRIGAATAGGDASTLVDKAQVDFLFPGENIIIETEPSISTLPHRPESGSSISTALAAGTAAMLLFITQLVDASLYEKLKNPKTMKLALTRLGSGNNLQYFDALKFSPQFAKTEWRWDQNVYQSGKGWEEVKKLVEHFVRTED